MIETFQLAIRIKDTVGVKRWATAVGRTQAHVYTWTHDPADPNAKGNPNLFDWLESTVDLLASRKEGRPVLLEIRTWFNGIIDRALSAWKPQPMTADELMRETSRVLREFSDFIDECGAADLCQERLAKEGAEAMEAIERLVRGAQVGRENERQPVRKIG